MIDPRGHWDRVYRTKAADQVSWYQPHLEMSLALIAGAAPDHDAHIIDVGGGESTLVDDLLDRGYRSVTVLDVSTTALAAARTRLAQRAAGVEWLCGDVTRLALPARRYDLWHDRAVFHFLTEPAQRSAYVRQVAQALKPGGQVVVATFGPQGPTKCSGLEAIRYDADRLQQAFGRGFRLVLHRIDEHRTPAGVLQQFIYCQFAFAPETI